MEARVLQAEKAPLPTEARPAGRSTEESAAQLRKATLPMSTRPAGRARSQRELQFSNVQSSIEVSSLRREAVAREVQS